MEELRVAMLSLHTSPWDQPGAGDAGGMNVYVRRVAEELGARGAEIDVFTRCAGRGVGEVEEPSRGVRIIQTEAGPCAPVPKDELAELLPRFVLSMLSRTEGRPKYDLIHAHYWLSGRAGLALRERWDTPVVASFHTLSEVKELAGFPGPPSRMRGERAVVAAADRLVASTPEEASQLVHLYDADPNRLRVVPPGVDLELFRPEPRSDREGPLALFVGRLHAVKGADSAITTAAHAIRTEPSAADLRLWLVGGPASGSGELLALRALAAEEGIGDRVSFLDPVPHEQLPAIYRAADVVLAPSRSESFGLAALEAQASGVPVIGSAVGGLRTVVADGVSGYLAEPGDAAAAARHLGRLLEEPRRRDAMGRHARAHAERFSWETTVDGLESLYGELVGAREAAAGG